jgi:hypothetical protein
VLILQVAASSSFFLSYFSAIDSAVNLRSAKRAKRVTEMHWQMLSAVSAADALAVGDGRTHTLTYTLFVFVMRLSSAILSTSLSR